MPHCYQPMRYILLLATILCYCAAIPAGAQTKMYYPDNSVKVYAYGVEQTLAWCSGFNNPQFSMGDLDHDGLPDLVIYEAGLGVKTFLNKGVAGSPDYRYEPKYALNFPPCFNFLILTDYNCDNIPDLFQRGVDGFSVYKGYYNSRSELCFTFYKDLFYNNDLHAGGPANAYDNPGGDIPAIVDVDNDGDLDFVAYDINGGTMNYYRNMQVEMGLPCDSIHIELKDRCWGKVYQGYNRAHVLGYTCDNSGLLRTTADAGKKTHSGNAACLFDWDMDGDYDYLDGSISFNEMTFLKNGRLTYGGSPSGGPDSMVYQDTLWQTGGKQIELLAWPAAFNIDIDQDGKKDLLVAPTARNASENYKCIWFYKNMTTPGVPDWQFRSDSFLVDKTIVAGEGTYPMLFDYNKDGKPDLIVGSDGYRQANGTLRAELSVYLNTSTTGHPSLTFLTRNLFNIDSFNFQGAAPAFGDLDDDGRSDMLLGHNDGTLSYFRNTAASEAVPPVWQISQLTLKDMSGTPINVDGNAAPFIYDIDKDGKPDVVIGNIYGTIQYYRNMSDTPGIVKLQLINKSLGHAKADPARVLGDYSTPFIGRIDSTGRDYLLMGSNSGNIYEFDSIQSGDTTMTYPLLSSQYSFIDSTYLIYNHPASSLAAYDNIRSSVTVGDIDGDGDYEMIVGNIRGGLEFYKRKSTYGFTNVQDAHEEGKVQLYPNPASDMLNINWSGIQQPDLQISIVNMEGQVMYADKLTTATQHTAINMRLLPSGVYVCVLQSGMNRYYNKFTIIR